MESWVSSVLGLRPWISILGSRSPKLKLKKYHLWSHITSQLCFQSMSIRNHGLYHILVKKSLSFFLRLTFPKRNNNGYNNDHLSHWQNNRKITLLKFLQKACDPCSPSLGSLEDISPAQIYRENLSSVVFFVLSFVVIFSLNETYIFLF